MRARRALRELLDGMAPDAVGREGSCILKDGRRVGWAEYGSGGPVILYCHGFPGSRAEARLFAPALAAHRVRVLALDRPGFGRSDPCPGRTIRSWVSDARQVLASLGIARCLALGVSGGAPYAFAMLHDAPEAAGGAIVCGLGPAEALFKERRYFFPAAQVALGLVERHPAFTPMLARLSVKFLRLRLEVAPIRYAGGCDREVLADPRVDGLLTVAQIEGLRQGSRPGADELGLYLSPWGFALERIVKPVTLWHGAADRIVPIRVAYHVVERLPFVCTHYRQADGHYSLPIRHAEKIVDALLQIDGSVSSASPRGVSR